MLCNPLCTAAFAAQAAAFFARRVPFEEAALLRLFGEQYRAYAARAPLGVPLRWCVRSELGP